MVAPQSVGATAPHHAIGGTQTTFRVSPATVPTTSTSKGGKMGGATAASSNGTNGTQNAAPYSARRSQALDLRTVERKGQPNMAREAPPKPNRLFGLQEAPTYRPTEEEFKDPFEYMRKIAPEAQKYGICKIIPPDSWNPPFAIDTERFHFRTRRQELNSVEGGTRANLNYLDQLSKFHKQHGNSLNRFPSVDKRPLDLYKLKKAVETRGGFEQVCRLKKWAEIGRDLGYSGKIMSSLSTSLKNSYQKWLHPYEEYIRIAKPGVHQMLEFENGGPFTPSPAPSPIKKSHQATPSSLNGESPAIRASAVLNASLHDGPAPPPEPPRQPMLTAGFTAVNSPGFTAVNGPHSVPASSSFSAINAPKTEMGHSTPQKLGESPLTSAKNTPDFRASAFGTSTPLNGQHPNSMKRQLSQDTDGTPNGDADGGSGRRSKRLKKDAAPTVAGSHMTQPRMSTPRLFVAQDRSNYKPGEICEACGRADEPKSILLCDSCDAGYHRHCLDPPLKATPEYDWHCPKCLVGTGEFGFEDGDIYSLRQFQEKANKFKENHFAGKMPFDPVLNTKKPVSEDDVEREFWRLVESLTETVEVEYGADVHSTTHGSGFPTIERNPRDPYSTDPWNLNILPLHPESLFRYIKTNISGMTVPWLYVGMCFSTFCWHAEDHYTYSSNYQHFGATKTWYGIPGEDAEKFEQAMRDAVPELFETQPDLLFQLVTLLTPEHLKKAGVRVYALDQRAGQFVMTFPRAYHGGFNHGFNFNEAVNFAPADWEPWGQLGVQKLQDFRRQPCFSHDELLLTAAAQKDNSIKTAKWLAPALERMLELELARRQDFVARHKEAVSHACRLEGAEMELESTCKLGFELGDYDVAEDDYLCSYCKAFGYLSRFQCKNSGKVLCLLHAGTVECCDAVEQDRLSGANADHKLIYRMTNEALENIVRKVVDKARTPEAWQEKVDKLLEDEPKPSLKALKSLVAEGEKIAWELPGLADLKKFVERCNDWVDEAKKFSERKQPNRRKNERAWRRGTASKAAEADERDREVRKLDNITKLLASADDISFDCPEINQLQDLADQISDFQRKAGDILHNRRPRKLEELEEILEVGKSFNVDISEVEELEKLAQKYKWYEEARERRSKPQTLQEVGDFIRQGLEIGIPPNTEELTYFQEQKQRGEFWETKAKELMSVENVHYQQLDALSKQASSIPVSPKTLAAVDSILKKQRDVQEKILSLYERSKNPDFRQRPMYLEVREAMEALSELNSKPQGTIDLEREQKRHEDWMRRGKKLFGKANAPLHILHAHMKLVDEKNKACFDTADQPRMPVEPASREVTPEESDNVDGSGSSRDVFCICRKPEAGMMIECELCHEWYHGKCLKIARGKVKEDDKYTCPICDYRVRIPRDATRPKLEDLQAWQDEVPSLPFQPEEEETLDSIISHGLNFRNWVSRYINPLMSNPDELITQRFYLRKLEGADILLANEINFFRQELHKWAPVAPEPPPILEVSLSTRKPRPTKQQKLMNQLGISNPDDLPQHLRTKPHQFKHRRPDSSTRPPPLQPAPEQSTTPPGSPRMTLGGSSHMYSDQQHGSSFHNSPMFTSNQPFNHRRTLSPTFDSIHTASGEPPLFAGPSFGQPTSAGSPIHNMFASTSSQPGPPPNIFGDMDMAEDGLGTSHADEALAMTAPSDTQGHDHEGNLAEFLNDA